MDWTKLTIKEIAQMLDEAAAQATDEKTVEEEMEEEASYGYFDYWED